jgi:type IV pilus assembly protein PilE
MKTNQFNTNIKSFMGFTLIELLVVIAIIALLAAYAIPNYRQYVVESKRSEAQAKLLEVAGLYEKFYATTNAYPTNLGTLNLGAAFTTSTDYVITGTGGNAWVLTATPQGGQATSDITCPTLTLNQLGQRGPSLDCWR